MTDLSWQPLRKNSRPVGGCFFALDLRAGLASSPPLLQGGNSRAAL
eukprot:CAMPEP_0177592664 /NCGR_PEP_ID=MMETSP0419_2-20121207/8685_1 /TAXON_ID=582737 /ORGANISM="Tetraselmis sp., Strain GSL018" /LENGTH=45 /DNA_ID= /DNA_START= /DNA_END= /DNA_ORIENTATION=